MGLAERLLELESRTPWHREDFRAGLAALTCSAAAESRQFAADCAQIAELAAMVPRCAGDEVAGTPWTSFRREIAVARSISDPAALSLIRHALRLSQALPHTRHLLQAGTITVARARTLLYELDRLDDELATQLDADLADRAATLSAARIRQEVRRALLTLEPDAAVQAAADATADRNVALFPQPDGQASVSITGPAVVLTRWHATLDQRARALRQAGDVRNLDQLRFDLATSSYPCATHPPEPRQHQPRPDRQAGCRPGR
jgi:hypothetical protein